MMLTLLAQELNFKCKMGIILLFFELYEWQSVVKSYVGLLWIDWYTNISEKISTILMLIPL